MADMDAAKEYLIELVRARKVLYSKSHQDFKDSRTVKRNNWDDIAKEMAKEHPTTCGSWKGTDASKAWTSLRDTFMSNRRSYEVRCASGAPGVSEPTWKFWPILKWLIEDMKKQSTVSNVASVSNLTPTLQETSPSSSSADNLDVESLPSTPQSCSGSTPGSSSRNMESVPSIPQSSSGSMPGTSSRKRTKTQKDAIDLTIASIDKEIKDLSHSFQPDDDMHVYAMSIAAKMRKLTEYQAAMARREMELVLFNIQYSCPPHPPPQPTSVHGPAQPYIPTQPYVPSQPYTPLPQLSASTTPQADASSMHAF